MRSWVEVKQGISNKQDETVFNDVLNISWDALQRMSWDNRAWTIHGDDTDTVRLLGHEYTYNDGSIRANLSPLDLKALKLKMVLLIMFMSFGMEEFLGETGITVIYGKRELGKAVAGENSRPDFKHQWKTNFTENSVAVFGKVKDSWDRDGDSITYSLDSSYPDAALFNIDSTTGEVTFKVAPNYEAPTSISSEQLQLVVQKQILLANQQVIFDG